MAQNITDKGGRTFALDLNIGCAMRIQDATGLNLLADTVFVPTDAGAKTEPSGMAAALPRLESDPVLLCQVLWAACGEEAAARNIDRTMFLSAWDGPALKTAYRSLVAAVADFFPDRRERILKMTDAIELARGKQSAFQDKAVEAGRKMFEGIDVDAMVDKVLAEAQQRFDQATRGTASGSLPAS